jgi:hypothetical protein
MFSDTYVGKATYTPHWKKMEFSLPLANENVALVPARGGGDRYGRAFEDHARGTPL